MNTHAPTQRPWLAGVWNIAALGLALYFLFSSLAATDTPKDAPFWAATGTLAVLAVLGIQRLAAKKGSGLSHWPATSTRPMIWQAGSITSVR